MFGRFGTYSIAYRGQGIGYKSEIRPAATSRDGAEPRRAEDKRDEEYLDTGCSILDTREESL
ncbi:MAG: hypothetical protein HQ580_12995 [Planctomycetes bacterium]|nr:hypothetical protein [Planctomycetota bacterium]